MGCAPMDVHNLKKDFEHKVQRDFADHYHTQFSQGESLMFVETNFFLIMEDIRWFSESERFICRRGKLEYLGVIWRLFALVAE